MICVPPGLPVWIDEGLEPGTPSWQAAIEEAIRQAPCLIVLLTPNSKASEWVQREVTYASVLGKRVIPLLAAGDVGTSVPISLINAQWVDIRQAYERAVQQQLLPALQRHLRPGESISLPEVAIARSTPIDFDWVTIPAGEFLMGSDKQKDKRAFDDEVPQHTIVLPEYRITRGSGDEHPVSRCLSMPRSMKSRVIGRVVAFPKAKQTIRL